MGNSINTFFRCTTKTHPRLLSGIWFSLAALPLVVMITLLSLLFLTSQSLSINRGFLLISGITLLPLISTALVGMWVGPHILLLGPGKTPQAALFGLLIGLVAFLLWSLILEISPYFVKFFPTSTASGDTPGAAIVVAYLVVLPGLLMVVMAFGAVAGIILHILTTNTGPFQEQNAS